MAMKTLSITLVGLLVLSIADAAEKSPPRGPVNPAIDMPGFLQVAQEAAKHRESRRLTEAEFIKMSKEPGTIVLDCRSVEKYNLMHIQGAMNISFPDITIESLKRKLPDLNARILIYCNNNFKNAEEAMPTKRAAASLNISTYISLYTYGYRNVYELGPQVDPKDSKLTFVGAKAVSN
jgi:hypothetical protein